MAFKSMDSFTDVRGVEVKRGDEVAYAVGHSSMAELVVGKVLDIQYGTPRDYSSWEHYRIKVQGSTRSKASLLEHPNRIVKIRSASEIEAAEHPRMITFGHTEYEQ